MLKWSSEFEFLILYVEFPKWSKIKESSNPHNTMLQGSLVQFSMIEQTITVGQASTHHTQWKFNSVGFTHSCFESWENSQRKCVQCIAEVKKETKDTINQPHNLTWLSWLRPTEMLKSVYNHVSTMPKPRILHHMETHIASKGAKSSFNLSYTRKASRQFAETGWCAKGGA